MAVLEINDLKKSYRAPDGTRTLVLDVPRFQLEEGVQQALRGASGSGKTTFLNLIAGILQPDSGTILLNQQNLSTLSESGRDRVRALSMGYVFQTFNLLQGYTALENVALGMMFGAGADFKRAGELLERVGLKDRMMYRPSQLSVGQQQRVAIARAVANSPKLVLADEPTGNLDTKNANESLELIRSTCREVGAALVLVSHDTRLLAQFDNVLDLSEINRASFGTVGTVSL